MSDNSTEQEEMKDKLFRIFCKWEFNPYFTLSQKYVRIFILDAFVDLFITLCILVNTAFMGMDHHGMSPAMIEVQKAGNTVSYLKFGSRYINLIYHPRVNVAAGREVR